MSDKLPPYPGNCPQQPGYPAPQQPGYPAQHGYPPAVHTACPQQPGYSSTTTTIIQQPGAAVVVEAPLFGELPVPMVCSNCHANIITATMYENGTLTWLACVGLCLIGCDGGCCLIPFCLDSLRDVTHICPNCQVQLGIFKRM